MKATLDARITNEIFSTSNMHHWASFTHTFYAYECRDDETKQIHKLQARPTRDGKWQLRGGKWENGRGNGCGHDNESVICDVRKEFCGVRQSTALSCQRGKFQQQKESGREKSEKLHTKIIRSWKMFGKIKSQVAECLCVSALKAL